MVFNSFEFLCLLPLILIVYYTGLKIFSGRQPQFANALLLVVSYAIYIYVQPAYTAVLLWVTLVTYFGARAIDGRNDRRKLLIWTLGVMAVGPLLVFKYAGFIVTSVQSFIASIGIADVKEPILIKLIIPFGISFFTLQSLGYLFDVYRGRTTPEKNVIDYFLFVSFFPQIGAGPINRADLLFPQIKAQRTFRADLFTSGVKTLLWGYFLKVVMADRLAILVDPVYANYQHFSGLTCFLASLAYSLQIYGDFAGYSLMALGVGKLLGFNLTINFERPYFATSVTQFWHRWHISLSTWLRDYVYIPLGGSRKGKGRTYGNIFITFMVSGIWHGANWTFIVWGGMHGLFQMVEKFFGFNKRTYNRFGTVIAAIITFLLVNFAWIFFRMPTFADAFGIINRIFTLAPGNPVPLNNSNPIFMLGAIAVVIFVDLLVERNRVPSIYRTNSYVRLFVYTIVVIAILLFGVLDAGQFIYVNF